MTDEDELETLQAKIRSIIVDLNGAYLIPIDQNKLSSVRTNIIELLETSTAYLNKTYRPLTSWQKDHIVETINALYWDWLHLAINSIRLAIADPSTISPSNKYKDEIVNLTVDDLAKQISIMKIFLKYR